MRRVIFTNIFAVIAASALCVFIIVNLIEEHSMLLTLGELAIALFSVFIVVYLRRTRDIMRTQTLVMIAAVLLLSLLFFTGGMERTGIFWYYAFPSAAFFLKGRRRAWAWLAIVLVEVVVMIALRAWNIAPMPYSFIELRQFMASFILVTLIVGNYERIRDDYEADIAVKTQALVTEIEERMQAEDETKRQLAEKEILLQEVHHRIKNNIASIGGLLSLHVESTANPEAVAVLQEAIGRVNSMRILYEKLLLTEGHEAVAVRNYIDSLVDSVVSLFPYKAKVTLDKQIADFRLDAKRLLPLGIIVNELLTNIMKYAFVTMDAGLITISLANAAGHVTLSIQDNGQGLPAGFDIDDVKGFGLMLVKMLSRQLEGSFSIENQTGTSCIIEFDI